MLIKGDGSTSFPDVIHAVFQDTDIQRCIVYQIRNSLEQMAWKDRKTRLTPCAPSVLPMPGCFRTLRRSGDENIHRGSCLASQLAGTRHIFQIPGRGASPDVYHQSQSLTSRVRKTVKGKSVFPAETALFKNCVLPFMKQEKCGRLGRGIGRKHWLSCQRIIMKN